MVSIGMKILYYVFIELLPFKNQLQHVKDSENVNSDEVLEDLKLNPEDVPIE